MVLGRVEVAGAKDDGKQRQYQRHNQRGVLRARTGRVSPCADQQVNAEHDAFELQGDVGQHAHQANQCDHNGQRLGLAVARGNKVSNGGDVLLLADHHHFLQHPRRTYQQQHRSQVDGQK